jgi:hypothetical protein
VTDRPVRLGKSSVGAELERRLVASGRPAYLLDGEQSTGSCADQQQRHDEHADQDPAAPVGLRRHGGHAARFGGLVEDEQARALWLGLRALLVCGHGRADPSSDAGSCRRPFVRTGDVLAVARALSSRLMRAQRES